MQREHKNLVREYFLSEIRICQTTNFSNKLPGPQGVQATEV